MICGSKNKSYLKSQNLKIIGQGKLNGIVEISGAKNSALVLLAASLLTNERIVLQNVPRLTDIEKMANILRNLGVKIVEKNNKLEIDSQNISIKELPYELVKGLRASFFCIGALLTKFGEAQVPLPGGCNIGSRPIDEHINGLIALGADIIIEEGIVKAKTSGNKNRLHGTHIKLNCPSVGATETLIMAASLAKGRTTIENAAREPEDSDAMTKSLEKSKIVELSSVGQFADGVAVKKIGKNTFDIARKYVDKMIRVNTDEICAAIKDVFEDTRSILEPAGALSIAGMKKDILNSNHLNKKMVAIACGANMNFERLRFVAERAELGEFKEVMMAVEIPERAGSLIDFCKLLDNRNLTEFSYRMSNSKNAQIFVGVQVYGLNDKKTLLNVFRNSEYSFIDISDDELSKNHLRHMVGGRLPRNFKEMNNRNFVELLYRFEFPERPGALINFLII